MELNKPVRPIAIVGIGVIGASWAAEFLAHGFDVAAADPAPNAEAEPAEVHRCCLASAHREGTGEECVERKTSIFPRS